MEKGFRMQFDKNTIDHLGIKLYSTFPPVIAELISNAYDAESSEVFIHIDYKNKSVQVSDNGHGMSHSELNNSFLKIGRNRRTAENNDGWSKNNKRKVTGKKGLGKLAVFGIAKTITVTSVSENIKNSMKINYDDMKNSTTTDYEPEALIEYQSTEEPNGTSVLIENIVLDTITDKNLLAVSLAKRFNFFDSTFSVNITIEGDSKLIPITRDLYLNSLEKQYEWTFPKDFSDLILKDDKVKFLSDNSVSGKIITAFTPLKKADAGFNVYARKKIAAQSIFFNDRSNDQFHTYVTGYFNIDVIDDDDEIDLISTARQSILWDQSTSTSKIKDGLDALVKKIGSNWKKFRAQDKDNELVKFIPEDFFDDLSPSEKRDIKRIKNSLINNSTDTTDYEPVLNVLKTVKNLYEFQSFQSYIDELDEESLTIESIEKIATDWEKIESKEMAKIAVGRIEAINQFEKFIREDASETKYIQPFLEKFPWILDPRITTFERELTFRKILQENFPETELEGSNKRLDFLCNLVNGELIIIELKRPRIKISQKEITQALSYKDFLSRNHKEAIQKGVTTYLISDKFTLAKEAEMIYPSLEANKQLFIKSYSDLLMQARQYNQEFIDLYENLQTKKEA